MKALSVVMISVLAAAAPLAAPQSEASLPQSTSVSRGGATMGTGHTSDLGDTTPDDGVIDGWVEISWPCHFRWMPFCKRK